MYINTCSAIIWTWNSNIYTLTSSPYSNWEMSIWRNTILYWINLDWEKDWIWWTHVRSQAWIYIQGFNSSTLSKIKISNFINRWLTLFWTANNIFNNILIYNIGGIDQSTYSESLSSEYLNSTYLLSPKTLYNRK